MYVKNTVFYCMLDSWNFYFNKKNVLVIIVKPCNLRIG